MHSVNSSCHPPCRLLHHNCIHRLPCFCHLSISVVHRFEVGLYDRVLLDAPCTSERHVVQAAMETSGVVSSSSWSREQCSMMAALQVKVRPAGDTGGALAMQTSASVLTQEGLGGWSPAPGGALQLPYATGGACPVDA